MMRRIFLVSIISIIVVILGIIVLVFSHRTKQGNPLQLTVSYMKAAEKAYQEGDFLEARELYKKEREQVNGNVSQIEGLRQKIEDLNLKIIFSPVIDQRSIVYEVESSDSLSKIAKEFNTTVRLIKRVNGISSDIIKPQQKLKVIVSKFTVAVDKSLNLLFLKDGDEVVKTYVVSTGKDNSTPTGQFIIINKLVDPTWFRSGAVIPADSPENILGTRWLGFDIKGYGIHGTVEPDKIGQQVTLGCVRMLNHEVEDLFDLLPVGTEVTIID